MNLSTVVVSRVHMMLDARSRYETRAQATKRALYAARPRFIQIHEVALRESIRGAAPNRFSFRIRITGSSQPDGVRGVRGESLGDTNGRLLSQPTLERDGMDDV